MATGRFRVLRCGTVGIEAVEADTDHTFPRHTHDTFGIGVINRGAQKSRSGRGLVEAGAGDTITVNPGEVHDGMPIGDAGRAWTMLYVDPSLAAAAAMDISEGRTATYEFRAPVCADADVTSRFRALFHAMTARTGLALALRRDELLLTLFASLMADRSKTARQPVPDAIRIARDRIDADPMALLTLHDLARETRMSQFQLIRGFAKSTGLTPHAYLVQRRLHLARRLITEGVSLAETAAASGFSDQSHMSRLFARSFGISPGAYARARA